MEHVQKAVDKVKDYVKSHHLEEHFVINSIVNDMQFVVICLFRWFFYGYKRYFFIFKLVVMLVLWSLLVVLEGFRYSEPYLKQTGQWKVVQNIAQQVFGSTSGGGGYSGGSGGGGSSGGNPPPSPGSGRTRPPPPPPAPIRPQSKAKM